ncbi:MAG: HD domain-containing protein [Saprospiraceae bacterium]|nr:HD domain-containing protein [Candidatus Opimibacter iunctus]
MPPVENQDIITSAEDYVRQIFEEKIPSNLYMYHNWVHTCQVRDEAIVLARQVGTKPEELELLNLASLFHDVGFSETYSGHEDHGIRIAKEFLTGVDYPKDKIAIIEGLINATRVDVKPTTQLEALLKDADTSSLGKPHFQIYTNSLRKELNALQNALLTKRDWAVANLRFLDEHEYFSAIGKERYGLTKEENKKLLQEELVAIDARLEEKERENINTIGTSKSAQTMFKTALRNHIDLSSIADNKANIMLSVNALIITFALPLLGKEIAANRELLYPTVLLLSVCVISMIFATLATRPIPMKGYSSMESILAKKSNLFFFGNFYRMSFDEYEQGMNATVADNSILDTTIMRDLFFLGRTLGFKYAYLRKCYTIFMFGIITTVIAFVVVFTCF